MRMIASTIAVLLACFVAAQDNAPKAAVMPIRSGKAALQHLVEIGALEGFRICRDGVVSSRYEHAVLTHSAWANLRTALDYLEKGNKDGLGSFKPLEPHQKQLATASVEVVRLIDEFSSELVRLGADTKQMLKEASTFKERFKKVLSDRFMNQPIATRVGEKGRMILAPDWAIKVMSRLRSEGLLVGYPDGLIKGSTTRDSRYEMTVATHAAAMNVVGIVDEMEKRAKAVSEGRPLPKQKPADLDWEVREVSRMVDYRSELLQLIDEFYFEILKLGGDPEQVVGLVDSAFYRLDLVTLHVVGQARRNFIDVPSNHWAAKAVNDLKAAGILHGYTSKSYGG
jgi:hypothetical protein